jgi:hypothetical protein
MSYFMQTVADQMHVLSHYKIELKAANNSPEPTAVGAVSSAVAVHATSRRWFSFFR